MIGAGYRIKTVAGLTGVPRNTLLAWERRYNFVSPLRSGNHYRLYSEADVARIREVKALVDEGHAVSEAIAILQARTVVTELPASPLGGETLEGAVDAIFSALVGFDRRLADDLFAGLAHVSYAETLERVLFPILRRVGDGWAAGDLTIVQEHFASAFCRDQLVAILLRLGCGPPDGPRVVCACMPDESHELGLLGVSIHLALKGWRVTHLGARVPEEQLRDFVAEYPPDLVCISVVVETPKKDLLGYARRLRKALPARTRLSFGGSGVPANIDARPWWASSSPKRYPSRPGADVGARR